MKLGLPQWSVQAMVVIPFARASFMFSRKVLFPSENTVWVWQSTSSMGITFLSGQVISM